MQSILTDLTGGAWWKSGRVPSLGRLSLLIGGCVVLGVGVGLLLTADLGSDGYSTLVNGIALSTGLSFWSPTCW